MQNRINETIKIKVTGIIFVAVMLHLSEVQVHAISGTVSPL